MDVGGVSLVCCCSSFMAREEPERKKKKEYFADSTQHNTIITAGSVKNVKNLPELAQLKGYVYLQCWLLRCA